MSSSLRNSNRKSQSHNKLNRVLCIDRLEDRRLLAGNLNGYYTDRNYFKAFPGQQTAEVAPATSTPSSSTQLAVSLKLEVTAAAKSDAQVAPSESTEINDHYISPLPDARQAAESEQAAAELKWLEAQPAGKSAPTTTNTTPAPTTTNTELATKNGSMPRSKSRVIALAASFVCSVEKTRCPVSAD